MKICLLIIALVLSSCATRTYDERANVQAKTQCPIGYHLKQTEGVVIFSGASDKNKHAVEFRCVADAPKDSDKKYGVSR